MSNYQVVTVSATAGLMTAGVILMSTAFVDLKSPDESMDRMRSLPTSNLYNVSVYAESTKSSTLGSTSGISYGVASASADHLLHQASLSFATNIANGMEVLGAEYLEVIEDNFWDLVLR
ncbi:hypothetical protein AL527_09945 [Pseudomonas fulva]|uniref:hypothetical protein n=1 Tax=Pseudomonas fulva TaxID=47880 RepID=UPI000CE97AE1|nr:hypothetical protein [Pseudomonas fulva]AVF55459.1 hypothetical protein AL527_09945 [Pseudomonas fulva]